MNRYEPNRSRPTDPYNKMTKFDWIMVGFLLGMICIYSAMYIDARAKFFERQFEILEQKETRNVRR